MALLPLQHDLASVVITLPPADIAGLQSLSPEAFNDEVARHYAHRLGAMHLVGERHVYPLVGVAPGTRRGRTLRLHRRRRDRHARSPHGYNLGLRGIALLADRILLAQRRGRDFAAMDVLVDLKRDLRAIAHPLYLATLSVVPVRRRPSVDACPASGIAASPGMPAPFRICSCGLAGRETRPPMPLRLIARLAALLPGRARC
ncbi:MAG: hypothetical protein IPP28_07310 [Xanthomonadales bacterium]|nr:hypothetical protein [Xanthomonadales bacterium]